MALSDQNQEGDQSSFQKLKIVRRVSPAPDVGAPRQPMENGPARSQRTFSDKRAYSPQHQGDQRAASARFGSSSAPPRRFYPPGHNEFSTRALPEQIAMNKRLISCETTDEVLATLEEARRNDFPFNSVNLATAFHRIAKSGGGGGGGG
eukprot:CAMPEP_0172153296 /NCGR_PEP_ID=MMETSP1050-20130122/1355_1 /TAXON_ID=233186 /ORGANISM="Cryptomonas curvata, Strain CCAP979/52" /LENGTH=148 /DNA_ID=CAMNT_0012821795 /DNA_START=333 /DNA_END=775 /DNA_ORIENTATION=-